ncbi:VOC family protein [Tateyamaria pelophila]|uniref:VOC family protein n=1 Tax=Tateyamaria pelophila TaxID=328415 RepID=UPI001CC076B3|nr:VOC family protein [Tateyamaria pelophila]
MSLGALKHITDICLLVEDIERTVAFYTEKLDLTLRRRAEGFADFEMPGVILAAWEIGHISQHTGVPDRPARAGHKACVAIELPSPAEVDRLYAELSARDVPFQGPPDDFMWNARCAYFYDPDGTVWELYAWLGGGPGDYHNPQKHEKEGE